MLIRIFLCLFTMLVISSCDESSSPELSSEVQEEKPPSLVLTKAEFYDLPEWGNDSFEGFQQAFARSCLRMMKKPEDQQVGLINNAGTYGDWQELCRKFMHANVASYKGFFEQNFIPYQVSADGNPVGLFTGYYEASLNGSYVKSDKYSIPLHKRPYDLVMVNLDEFREDLKGIRIAGRVKEGNLKPYETRAEIVSGEWMHQSRADEEHDEVLLWVDSAVDAFFVQIQGSGLVQMEDGSTLRIGYDGQNGHPYYAIGRELVKTGALEKEKVSMQSIRVWLEQNSDKAGEVMNTNKSYVFFREINGEGPIGGEGVALTSRRSIAVDRTLIPYGLPFWISLEPMGASKDEEGIYAEENDIEYPDILCAPLSRMMVAQDTGGAIIGPVRADIFWGYGGQAENIAGLMNAKGRYWVLLPRVEEKAP